MSPNVWKPDCALSDDVTGGASVLLLLVGNFDDVAAGASVILIEKFNDVTAGASNSVLLIGKVTMEESVLEMQNTAADELLSKQSWQKQLNASVNRALMMMMNILKITYSHCKQEKTLGSATVSFPEINAAISQGQSVSRDINQTCACDLQCVWF